MKVPVLSSLVVVASIFQGAQAWGNMGHQAIGYIAQNFVSESTATYCKTILGDSSTSYLANVATWADSYRYTDAGAFSKPYHFIDAQDNPPESCGADFNRDCGAEGCVVSAINNYTHGLLAKADVDSLKFIVHFVGDLHQPLHDEAIDIGGNGIGVHFAGNTSNLHHIWDTEMPEKRAGGGTQAVAKSYARRLTNAINTGTYSSDKCDWLTGVDVSDPVATSMLWVQQANSYVCSTVLNKGLTYVEGTDLAGDYYDTALPIFEEQIARAGYRLAAWLNLIATGSLGLCATAGTTCP